MDAKPTIVCESCGEIVSARDLTCPFCTAILDSPAWRNVKRPSLLQRAARFLQILPSMTIGLIVIYLAALFICLLILALIFGSLAFLANVLGRTGATYSNMIAHAHHNGIDVVLLLVGVVIAVLLLLLGAHRFWKKRVTK